MLITTSGLSNPCAVEKFGSVSDLARTDLFLTGIVDKEQDTEEDEIGKW